MDTETITALNAWSETWSQTDLALNIAVTLTCTEVDAIAQLLRAGGYLEEVAT